LRSLREFFDSHVDVLERHPCNVDFFDEWLNDPITQTLQPGTEYWTPERITRLQSDVKKLRA
jgi:hypothetical protein